jgi:hypothetical protein
MHMPKFQVVEHLDFLKQDEESLRSSRLELERVRGCTPDIGVLNRIGAKAIAKAEAAMAECKQSHDSSKKLWGVYYQ